MIKDRRAYFRANLHALYLPYYDSLCGILPSHWQPLSGVRSFLEQDRLYASGRTEKGPIVTQAKSGLSFHNYGLATDWDIFENGRYLPLDHDDPLWKEYIDACQKVGLRCIEWEKPHNEIDCPVPVQRLLMLYQSNGMPAVNDYLERIMNHGNDPSAA